MPLQPGAGSRGRPGGLENREWRYLGGDAGHTRSNPGLDQIDASTFADLEVAWIWRGDNFGPAVRGDLSVVRPQPFE